MADKREQKLVEALDSLKAIKGVHTPPKMGIVIKMSETQEGMDLLASLDEYRRSVPLTWKDFVLIGMAEYVARDNPSLAIAITDYIKRKKKQGRPHWKHLVSKEGSSE